MAKTIKIVISVDGQDGLAAALSSVPGIHLDCGSPRRQDDGKFLLTVYGSEAQLKRLAKSSTIVEIDKELDARLAERQAEVGIGDRFDNGRVAPEGVGKLVIS